MHTRAQTRTGAQAHRRTQWFWRFHRLRTRTEKVSTKHQKWYKQSNQHRWTNNAKSMLKKWCNIYIKSSKVELKREPKTIQKPIHQKLATKNQRLHQQLICSDIVLLHCGIVQILFHCTVVSSIYGGRKNLCTGNIPTTQKNIQQNTRLKKV